jgi:rRNA maturation endonuclease Nob1
MKNNIEIPVPKEEDIIALKKRREDYAVTRDLQALEYNQSIAKRILANIIEQVKCQKCGKEFSHETGSEEVLICPDCQ